jgi:hypothetical protein
MTSRSRPIRTAAVLLYALGLVLFYLKYVPRVTPFQIVYLPILAVVAFLSATNPERGLLAFVFTFPLVNNLPYFFGITEPLPFSPTALPLFLFFFGGWLVYGLRRESPPRLEEPILKPLGLAAAVVVVSSVITFWRYANFFPLRSSGVYEWAVNAHGVSSGGAFMSILFFGLNYLTAFGFFFVFLRTVRSLALLKRVLTAFGLASLLAVGFGFVQHLVDLRLGNNPLSIATQIINGTFKDALSFGCFLSMALPLFLGWMIVVPGWRRVMAAVIVAAGSYIILFAGSRSGFFGFWGAVGLFLILGGVPILRRGKSGRPKTSGRRAAAITLAAVLVLSLAGFVAVESGFLKRVQTSRAIQRLPTTSYEIKHRLATLWRFAFDCLAEFPLTGVGVGAYIIESSNYAARDGVVLEMPESAENYFLQVAAELGIAGLLCFLWFFWEIFQKIRRGWKAVPHGVREKWIFIGSTAGLSAYVFNIQTHSYIGSFEIKYTFWLLVGVIYVLNRSFGGARQEEPAVRSGLSINRRFKIVAGGFLAAFAVLFLWNSTHGLSLARRAKAFGIPLEFGLGKPEKTDQGWEFRWTGENAGIPLDLLKSFVVLPLQAAHPDIRRHPVRVEISLSPDPFGKPVVRQTLLIENNYWQDYRIAVPPSLIGRKAVLLLKVSRTWNPWKSMRIRDSRNLGVAVGKVEFEG